MTRVLTVDAHDPDPTVIEEAASIIRRGGLVAFPTETVYGLGANALDADAVRRIFAAKGRPGYNPLIVHIASVADASRVVSVWPENAARLADRFWPGPLTMVLPRAPSIPDAVTAGLNTVGVRLPSHQVARALILASGVPIAAPSANPSMAVSPTVAAHVAAGLGEGVDLILDAGPSSVGIESTVLDLTSNVPVILRPGSVTAPEIVRVIGPVAQPVEKGGDGPRKSPGMLDRHYSPRARVLIVEGAALADEAGHRHGARVGSLVYTDAATATTTAIHLAADARGYASQLYAALHSLDDAGVDVILVERVPSGSDWDGVRDRLGRAAHQR